MQSSTVGPKKPRNPKGNNDSNGGNGRFLIFPTGIASVENRQCNSPGSGEYCGCDFNRAIQKSGRITNKTQRFVITIAWCNVANMLRGSSLMLSCLLKLLLSESQRISRWLRSA